MEPTNPYQSPAALEEFSASQSVRANFSLKEILTKAAQLLAGQYWLFLAFTCLSMFAASFVPFGLLFGPALVGLFLCLKQCEQGASFDLNTLLKGFDSFLNSLIVMIANVVVNLIISAPLVIGFLLLIVATIRPGDDLNPWLFISGVILFVIVANVVSLLAHLPFLFCFQLIADRNVTAIDAIKMSANAVWQNLGSVVALSFVGVILGMACVFLCFIPILFFMPYWLAVLFVAYRQIFPTPANSNAEHPTANLI